MARKHQCENFLVSLILKKQKSFVARQLIKRKSIEHDDLSTMTEKDEIGLKLKKKAKINERFIRQSKVAMEGDFLLS